jgi:hypothetical protein
MGCAGLLAPVGRGVGDNGRMRWLPRAVGLVISVAVIVLAQSAGLRALGVLLLIGDVVAASVAEAMRRRDPPADLRTYSRAFHAAEGDAYAALSEALDRLRYRRLSGSGSQRTVRFNTRTSAKTWAGQDYEAVVRRIGVDTTAIELTGGIAQRGLGRIQATSWGETDALASKIFDRVEHVLEGEAT